MPLQKNQLLAIVLVLTGLILYLVFGYDLERSTFLKLLSVYSALFLITYAIITYTNFSFRQLVFVSFIFRLSLLLAVPNLSQDFFRFIWDGQLILEGINPYLFTPDQIFEKGILPLSTYWHSLYEGMGPLSAMHFSNYPPLNQFCFAISAFIGGKSLISTVVAMRVIIISADLGILYFGSKLLERLEVPRKKIFWYLLNPFIIIELTGNLHFEGVMLFFLIWSLYYYIKVIGSGLRFF